MAADRNLKPRGTDRHPGDRLVRELSLTDATLLVVSSVIGVGIFLTPGSIADTLPHPAWFLAAWLTGGLLSLAGALANAELGAMFPRAGGNYVYLSEAFHPAAGFLAGWISFFVIYAGTIATLAIGFAEGVAHLLPMSPRLQLVLALAATIGATAVNYVGVRSGARMNNATAALKLFALALLVIGGPLLGGADVSRLFAPAATPASAPATAITWQAFALALSPVLFSYLGWNASVYVASEIHEPEHNIPRSLFIGLAVCTTVYLATNFLYLLALPMETLRREPNAGEAAARALFGAAGGTIAALLVVASILGCLNATVLVGPRIAYAMALDHHFFPAVARVHDEFRTPHVALLAQATVAIALLLLLRSFPSVLDYTTFAIVISTIADTAALYALRRSQPKRHRPYHARGYPLLPALYLVANLAIAVSMLVGRPFECAVALLIAVSGLPFFVAFRRTKRQAGSTGAA